MKHKVKVEVTIALFVMYCMVEWAMMCEPGSCIKMMKEYWLPVWWTLVFGFAMYIIWRPHP